MLKAEWMLTGPLMPMETPLPSFLLSPENANNCPKLRTSIHSSHAAAMYDARSFSFLAFCRASLASARSRKLLKPSVAFSCEMTNTFSPRSQRRLRSFRLMHTSVTSPYPS